MGLASHGLAVHFCMPRRFLDRFGNLITQQMWDNAWDDRSIHQLLGRIKPDLIIVCGWGGPMRTFVYDALPDAPILLDQHGPHLLERAFQHHRTQASNQREKVAALARADFFSCAGRLQLEYFKPFLAQADWTPGDIENRSVVLPLALSPEVPVHDPQPPLTFVFGGVFLPWQDPSVGLTTLTDVLEQRHDGRLDIFGSRHLSIDVPTGIFDKLLGDLLKHPRVRLRGMVPNQQLRDCYRQSHVAIDLMARNRERELAVTTRTVEYLWCGLPVIYNDFSELSSHIAEYEAGWIVDPSDKQAIAKIVHGILDDPTDVARRSANAQRLARDRFAWDVAVQPLQKFEAMPARPGKAPAASRLERINDLFQAARDELLGSKSVADVARLAVRIARAGVKRATVKRQSS